MTSSDPIRTLRGVERELHESGRSELADALWEALDSLAGDSPVHDEYEEFAWVPTVELKRAIACLSYDAKAGYKRNATAYADHRHAAGRVLARATDVDYTDYPEVATRVPEGFLDGE